MISRDASFNPITSRAVFPGDDGEQAIVAEYLGEKPGYYIDVGAFHPTEFSQSHHLELAGWDGICIEPVPTHANNFVGVRKCEVIQAACVGPDYPGEVILISDQGQASSIVLKRSGAQGHALVPALTLNKILSDRSVSHVDFISIDVEGMEIDVLRGLSIDKYSPRLILLEDFAENTSRHRYMRSVGYKRVRRTGNNSWYVPDSAYFPVSVFGWLQIFRKYYLSMPVRWFKNQFRPPQH